MRPTLLNFRSPKEKTPDYYDVQVTHQGERLNFRSVSTNKKRSNLPQADRFPKNMWYHNGNGASCFLGPGAYNDHEDYLKLTKNPCSLKMVNIIQHQLFQAKIIAVPESESGKPCYIMVGNNLTFEASFLSTRQEKKELQSVNADQCSVNLAATIKRRSISTVKQRLNASDGFQIENSTSLREDSQPEINQSFKQSTQSQVYSNGQGDQVVENVYYNTQRPQTTQNGRIKTHATIPNFRWNASVSTKASLSGKVGIEGQQTIGQSSSNIDKSTTMDVVSAQNLSQINEEDQRGNLLSQENQVRIKSMLPRTAENFHKMKKGLYLNPLKGYPYNMKEEALARSFNILQAYGEILPQLGTLSKRRKSRDGSRKPQKKRRSLANGVSDSNYMNVIRDSPRATKKKEDLEKMKRDILNMKFDDAYTKKQNNSELNKFLNERQGSQSVLH